MEEKTQKSWVFSTKIGNVSIIFNKVLTKFFKYGTIKYRKKPLERPLNGHSSGFTKDEKVGFIP